MKRWIIFFLIAFQALGQSDEPNSPVHLREIPKYNVHLQLGILESVGDFKEIALSGTQVDLGLSFYLNKHIGIAVNIGVLGNTNTLFEDTSNRENNWKQTTISSGLVYSHTIHRFQIDTYAYAGIGFLNYPSTVQLSQNNSDVFLESAQDSYPFIHGGLRFNYYFRRSVQVYFSPSYMTSLGAPITVGQSNGNIGATQDIDVSNITFAIGVKIAISPKYSNGEKRKDD